MGLDLVTLAEYKAYTGMKSTEEDSQLTALITYCSAFVKNICNRSFIDYVDDAKVSIFKGGDYLCPLETPLISVTSVEYSTDGGATYAALTEYVDWTWDLQTDSIFPLKHFPGTEFHSHFSGMRYNQGPPTFQQRINGYRVTYNGGFDPLPVELKLAVMDLITYYRKHDTAIHSNRSPGSNAIQIQYITKSELPANIQRILSLYEVNYN